MTDTPDAIDRQIMLLNGKDTILRHEARRLAEDLRDALGLDRSTLGIEAIHAALAHQPGHETLFRLDWTRDRIAETAVRREALESLFRQTPWSRYLIATWTGVVHRAPACAGGTVRRTTRVAPLPHFSGQDPAVVAAQVRRPCGACFRPSQTDH